jgi:hypothetical protein
MSHDTMPPEEGRCMVEALGLETNDVTFDEENEYGVKVPKNRALRED